MFVYRSVSSLLLAAIAIAGCAYLTQAASSEYKYPFQNPALNIEDRVSSILNLKTLEEKIECLGTTPDVPRLGIKGSAMWTGCTGWRLAARHSSR